MAFTKSRLFRELQKSVTEAEWDALERDHNLAVSSFNRNVLLGWKNEKISDDLEIPEEQVMGLHMVLREFLETHMGDNPGGWKWVILSCIYLAFIAERPLHSIEVLDIKELSVDGKTVYECPVKSNGKNTPCRYCVCWRMSNYEIMKRKMQKEFLNYNQEEMIQKFCLTHDADYLYIKFLGHMYRIHRGSGKTDWSDDGFCTFSEAGYNEAMTIYDVLCYSSQDCGLSGEFVNMDSLSFVQGSSASQENGLFQKMEQFFDHKNEAMARACRNLGGVESGKGDIACRIPMFDFFPVIIRFWNSDEEFPASLQVYTDKNVLKYMHYETLWFAVLHLFERIKEEMA